MAVLPLPRTLNIFLCALLLLIALYLQHRNKVNTKAIKKMIEKIDTFERKIENSKEQQLNGVESRLDEKLDNIKETIEENFNNECHAKWRSPEEDGGFLLADNETFYDKNLQRGVPE